MPPAFAPVLPHEPPVGEIWFEDGRGEDAELLVKYLFTSEKLSVQVHPDDEFARKSGKRCGKDEAWWVLSADDGATIGLGLVEPISKSDLRTAALDGRIESLVDWRPVRPCDSFYSPAGTIHAIGPGLTLIEIQQNTDQTYRLFDYGRGRRLHLDQAVAAADAKPLPQAAPPRIRLRPGREVVAAGKAFVLERWADLGAGRLDDARSWIVPLDSGGLVDGHQLAPGDVWIAERGAAISIPEDCSVLVAYPGGAVREQAFIG